MKSNPKDNSSLETECLFGEKLEFLDKYDEWIFGKLLTDNYVGWIKRESLGVLENPTHKVLSVRSGIYTTKSVKANFIHYLPFGSKLSVKNTDDYWAEINLSDKHNHQIGYVPSKDIIKINEKVTDWVSLAEQFVGTPYKWGGRDSMGLDCSALVQLSYDFYGEIIPRNTKDQVKIKKEVIHDFKNLKRGCVVFWDGHVGIMVDNLKCLHSNAFHMKTIIEPLDDIIRRAGKASKITKVLNFNN